APFGPSRAARENAGGARLGRSYPAAARARCELAIRPAFPSRASSSGNAVRLHSDRLDKRADVRERPRIGIVEAAAAPPRAALLEEEARAELAEAARNLAGLLPAPARLIGQAAAPRLIAFPRVAVARECEQLQLGLVAAGSRHVLRPQAVVADLRRPVVERVG